MRALGRLCGAVLWVAVHVAVLASSVALARSITLAWPAAVQADNPLVYWPFVAVLAVGVASPWLALAHGCGAPAHGCGRFAAGGGGDTTGALGRVIAGVCGLGGYGAGAVLARGALAAGEAPPESLLYAWLVLVVGSLTLALALTAARAVRAVFLLLGLAAAVAAAWLGWRYALESPRAVALVTLWIWSPAHRLWVSAAGAGLVLGGLLWLVGLSGARRRWVWWTAVVMGLLAWPTCWFGLARLQRPAEGLERFAVPDYVLTPPTGLLAKVTGDRLVGWRWVPSGYHWYPSLLLQPPGRVSGRVTVPADGRLRLLVALPRQTVSEADRSVRVRATLGSGGGGDVATSDLMLNIASAHDDFGAWQEVVLAAPGAAGTEATLAVETSGVSGSEGEVPAAHLPLVALAGVSRAPADTGPSCLVVLVDALRADRLHCYGFDRETSPCIDELAADGVQFERAITACSWTLPSVASLFTGTYVATHKMDQFRVPGELTVPTLAERLGEAGVYTAAVSANAMIFPGSGVARGFDEFTVPLAFPEGEEARADLITDEAIALLRRLSGRRFFLYLHYMEPHEPYDPPAGWARFGYSEEQRYLGEIRYCDHEIGRLLDELDQLGRRGDTLVVFVADHGEAFKEHGFERHGRSLHVEEVRVPLILRWPGRLPAGARVTTQVRTIDLYPTIADLLGAEGGRHLEGQTLLPLLEAGGDTSDRLAVSETEFVMPGPMEPLIAVDDGQFKYVRQLPFGYAKVFNVKADPEERKNVLDKRPGVTEWMEGYVRAFLDARQWRRTRRRRPTAAEERRLRAVGYLRPGGN